MNVHNHAIVGALLVKCFTRRPAYTLAAIAGSILPDAVSALEKTLHWLHLVDHEWTWRNLAHGFDDGLGMFGAGGAALLTLIGVSYKASHPLDRDSEVFIIGVPLAYLYGYLLHLAIDDIWHAPGGGWYGWGVWADLSFTATVLLMFWLDWRSSNIPLKQYALRWWRN